MSLHPDDPPISPIAGTARVFRSHEALARLVDIVPSECNGLGFCQGTISEMPGDVLDAIRYFGSRDKINYVHFRFVSGPVPAFSETFIDQGHVDPMEFLLAYDEAGVDCPMIDDHVPRLATDPGQGAGRRVADCGPAAAEHYAAAGPGRPGQGAGLRVLAARERPGREQCAPRRRRRAAHGNDAHVQSGQRPRSRPVAKRFPSAPELSAHGLCG